MNSTAVPLYVSRGQVQSLVLEDGNPIIPPEDDAPDGEQRDFVGGIRNTFFGGQMSAVFTSD